METYPLALEKLPPQVAAIVQSLVQRPNFWCEAKLYVRPASAPNRGPLHTVVIFFPSPYIAREDWFVNLQFQMHTGPSGGTPASDCKPYARELIPEYVPELIHQLAEELVVGCSATGGSTVLTQVSVSSDHVKWLRLEQKYQVCDNFGSERMVIRAQINWAQAGCAHAAIFVPTRHLEQAVGLLTTRAKSHDSFPSSPARFFFNRLDAERQSLTGITHETDQLYLVQIACNQAAIAAALMDEGTIEVGEHRQHKTLSKWVSAANKQGSEGFAFSQGVDRVIATLPPEAFSLHHRTGDYLLSVKANKGA